MMVPMTVYIKDYIFFRIMNLCFLGMTYVITYFLSILGICSYQEVEVEQKLYFLILRQNYLEQHFILSISKKILLVQ